MEEASFPRGLGTSTDTSKKRGSSSNEIESSTEKSFKKSKKEDNLFGNDFVKKRRSTALVPRNSKSNERGFTSLPQGIQPGGGAVLPSSLYPKRDALIQNLSFAKLDKGTKLLGVVREDGVNDDYCIVSLPNMLTGFIRRGVGGGDDKTPLTKVLSPLQMLPVVVKSTSLDEQSKRKIELSIYPQDMNAGISPDQLFLSGLKIRGQIMSIEDHGCIVNVGMGNSVTAFLKFENVHGYDVDQDINVGRCFDFRVQKPTSLSNSTSSRKDKKRRREKESAAASRILIQLILPCNDGKNNDMSKQISRPTGPSALIGGGLAHGKDAAKASYTIKSLLPGMLVECEVEEYAKNGVLVTFLGSVFRGAIDENHLGFLPEMNKESTKWKEVWKEEACVSEFMARIIAVDPTTKILRLSLLPHILSLAAPPRLKYQTGDVIKETIAVHANGSIGAILATGSDRMEIDEASKDNSLFSHPLSRFKPKYGEDMSRVGIYVSAAKASDNEDISENDLGKLFRKDHTTETPVRILTSSHCLIENFYTASTAPSIISAHVLSHSDLKPGKIYRNTKIISYQDYGVIVSLGQNIRALCQTMHLSDAASKSGSSSDYQKKAHRVKFAPGKSIDVRCLAVDVINKQAYVTHKKSMLSDKLSSLTSYDQIAKNQIYTGCITKVDSIKGIIVSFYNNIYGYCTSKRLAKELGVEEVSQSYRVGSVIKCRIIQLNRRNKKLELSLDTTVDAIEKDQKEMHDEQNNDLLKAGMHIPATAMKVIEMINSSKNEKNKLVYGYASVVVKLKYLNSEEEKSKGEIECRIPYDQIDDKYEQDETSDLCSIFDEIARSNFKVGKRIKSDAIVLQASNAADDGVPVLSLRPQIVSLAGHSISEKKDTGNFVPSNPSELYIGAKVTGYVTRIDQRYGGFVRFSNKLTGLIPKLKKGLEQKMYSTITCRVLNLDVNASPPRIILRKSTTNSGLAEINIAKGDIIGDVVVESVNFYRANVTFIDKKFQHKSRVRTLRARLHVTMIDKEKINTERNVDVERENHGKDRKPTESNPLYGVTKGAIIRDTICVSVDRKDGILYVELTNRVAFDFTTNGIKLKKALPPVVDKLEDLPLDEGIPCIVKEVLQHNWGLKVLVCPGFSANISGLELSDDIDVLNNLSLHYKIGQHLTCKVIKNMQPFYKKQNKQSRNNLYGLSALPTTKPKVNDVIIAKVNRKIPSIQAPSLMLDCRQGRVARCCITELAESEEWVNMPLGRQEKNEIQDSPDKSSAIVTDEENESDDKEDINESQNEEESEDKTIENKFFPTGKYVKCKILRILKSVLEVSLQERRINGNIEDDLPPQLKDIVQAYVVETNKKGCYTRLSRNMTGRIMLKELSDAFLPEPSKSFPRGRLVQCKVKKVKSVKGSTLVDLDMRESSILESQNTLTFEEIREGDKYKGIITRIERYGVFVRLENSQVSGLAHISECSDKFMKDGIGEMYDPGDLVKAYVLKIDNEQKKVNFSLKASYFEGDIDSDDESSSSETESSSEADVSDDDEMGDNFDEMSLNSDDSNFASKLASKMKDGESDNDEHSESGESSEEDESDDESEADSSSEEEDNAQKPQGMDTDIGFDWGGNEPNSKVDIEDASSSDSDSSSSDDEDHTSSNHKKKSRKKAAQKRQEEKEIALRESALADGTLDENPETRADFERLIASNPNFSEHWIKYMAYYLSLADVESARNVANRAFDRIEFRQEGEKLNVWTALLTLELKYGSPTSLQGTIDRACQHNNPKQVYLRVCEMLEKLVMDSGVSGSMNSSEKAKFQVEAVKNADEMFQKMCKKFKSKKTVWIAHLKYLLKSARHQDAHDLLKRSMKSLPSHKHIETMTKFAQMEFEFGNVERGRTIFDSLLLKYAKRLDLLYVYVDKEVKAGEIEAARSIFRRVANPNKQSKFKFSDKQMKSLFKKWYRIEESNGTDDSREEVKAAAKAYVESSAS